MALVNDAVYIAQYYSKKKDAMVWEPTGAQFKQPYVFKRLFSQEPIAEDDYGITKQVRGTIYMDDKFIGKIARVYASKDW